MEMGGVDGNLWRYCMCLMEQMLSRHGMTVVLYNEGRRSDKSVP